MILPENFSTAYIVPCIARNKREILKHKIILELVSDYFGLEVDQILGKSRIKNIAIARHIAVYLTRKYTTLSLKKIGSYYGGRDHSTCLSSVRYVEGQITSRLPNTVIYDVKKLEELI